MGELGRVETERAPICSVAWMTRPVTSRAGRQKPASRRLGNARPTTLIGPGLISCTSSTTRSQNRTGERATCANLLEVNVESELAGTGVVGARLDVIHGREGGTPPSDLRGYENYGQGDAVNEEYCLAEPCESLPKCPPGFIEKEGEGCVPEGCGCGGH
uniref:Uncharacterized protein n=1 Tax=Anopheles farauti TaxID=69004 RepID=A0A182QL41_9DIPT